MPKLIDWLETTTNSIFRLQGDQKMYSRSLCTADREPLKWININKQKQGASASSTLCKRGIGGCMVGHH